MSRIEPERATTMTEVRAGVDAIDRALVALLAERFAFMDAAARIKPCRASVRDEARKREVLANVLREGTRLGLDPALLHALWDRLVEASIAHELRAWDRLRADAGTASGPHRRGRGGPCDREGAAGQPPDGASDGARTRDLRRDRPAL